MMRSEFEKMTGVKVSLEEYNAIETVYMNSDVNKLVFCQHWVKLNHKRVAKAKEERAKAKADEKLMWELSKCTTITNPADYGRVAYNFFSDKKKETMRKVGIETMYKDTEGEYHFPTVSTIIYEIRDYFRTRQI